MIGSGSFGIVWLVMKNDTYELFAMKMLIKAKLKATSQAFYTLSNYMIHKLLAERNILSKTKCPFIVTLYYAFQTKDKLYFVMEFMKGGELFYYLKAEHRFCEGSAIFYAAEILVALGYLHSQNIIYRDLKPENILVDAEGHIKIADFGLSKETEGPAYSRVGTPNFVAPELLKSAGYGKEVDWWSFVLIKVLIF